MKIFREPVSGFTHLGAGILAIAGLVWLIIVTAGEPPKLLSVIVYGSSLILLYAASTTLHLVRGPQKFVDWLTRIDHAAIYLFIAGTYTPICYHYLNGSWRLGILGSVWMLAVLGVTVKLTLGVRQRLAVVSTMLYVGMGWIVVCVLPQLVNRMSPLVFWLMFAGGVTYTFGAIFYLLDKPEWKKYWPVFGMHEIWHIFVMAASGLHYAAIIVALVR